jgi:hypothetical protein
MGLAREIARLVTRKFSQLVADIHTHMPAQVVSYDNATNTCEVRTCIKRLRTTDAANLGFIDLPVLTDVPVRQFGSGKCLISVAPQIDSYGFLHVSARSIATWLIDGGIVAPSSMRKFDLSDAVFEPGLYPLKADGDNGLIEVAINTDRIEMRTRAGTTAVSVLDDESVSVNTENSSIVIAADESITVTTDGQAITFTDGTGTFETDGSGVMSMDNGSGTIELKSNGQVALNGTNLTVDA